MNRRSLGLTISETRGTTEFIAPLGHYSHRLKTDFAVLEALLNLFAILLPSFSAPQKRTSYIQDVFFNSGNDVINLLDGQPAREWDETATKVIDILANSDISLCAVISIPYAMLIGY